MLLFFASVDHPQRDAACATLAWLAADEGSLFECYYDSPHTGVHFGGGHPSSFGLANLLGGTVTGGRHLEAFYLLLQRFDCEAVCLGPTLFDGPLEDSRVPVRSRAADIATFYEEVFARASVPLPRQLLVIGDAGRTDGIRPTPYAFPEVFHRKCLALTDGDEHGFHALAEDREVDVLWLSPEREAHYEAAGYRVKRIAGAPSDPAIAAQTAWMANRWLEKGRGYVLGDPELIGRWIPTAARLGWLPLYGLPQADVIARMGDAIAQQPVVYGRQQHDQDFFQLSKLGVAFQLLDPGRPPFPVVRECSDRWPVAPESREPSSEELGQWADEGRILTTLLFWSGMVRELESLYALVEVLTLTGLDAGLVLTTESFDYAPLSPLRLVQVPREAGGLFPSVELLLADAGVGGMIASEATPERFATTLKKSVATLTQRLGGDRAVPKGWWGTMDAPLCPGRRPWVGHYPSAPRLRIRYRPLNLKLTDEDSGRRPSRRERAASVGKRFGLRRFLDPLRPYEAFSPGAPGRAVLQAVRDAGFTYAFTKSGYGPVSRVVEGVDDLTVLNYTAGRWDGWSPFVTINDIRDLETAEHQLLRSHKPGWLVGTLDSCLWAFSGHVLERGRDLFNICDWASKGGGSRRLINTTPATVARYAKILAERGKVERISAR